MKNGATFSYLLISLMLLAACTLNAQERKSRADELFYQYQYQQAIVEYLEEREKSPLTNQQLLNLADAYFKTGAKQQAETIYLEVFKRDNTMAAPYFNKMLLSMARENNTDRIKAFIDTRRTDFTPELLENAQFNFDLLENDGKQVLDFQLFNVQANSGASEFSPSFYKDQLLFASSRGHENKEVYGPTGEAYTDIFLAYVNQEGNIISASRFDGIPESPFHQATPYYVENRDLLFYVRSNTEGEEMFFNEEGKNTLAIGLVDGSGEFRYAFRDQNTSFYYPFFDENTDRLYFSAELEGGYGGTDLYYVNTNNGLIMSSPLNLGPRINGPGNEIAPFIFENSLYFSSDIFYGLGGMDVYSSKIQDNEFFSIPVNLGKEINTSNDEFGFIIRNYGEQGLLGYFSSNRPGGKGKDDLYGFRVAEKPGVKTFALRGHIINDFTGIIVPEAQIRVLDNTGNVLKEMYAAENGTYQFEIPWEEGIRLEVTKDKHSQYIASYNEEQMEALQESLFDIRITFIEDIVEEKEGQTVLKLNKAYFRRGQSRITPEVSLELDKVVDVIQKFPELQLRIESHTDSRGGSATNFRISQNRANAIKTYLISKGVPESNILYAIGYGEDKILNNCTNGVYCLDTFHKENERQLIVVLNYNILY